MVRWLSIWLLGWYMVASLRPYFPFVEYQLNRAYYAEVLCQNQDRPELHCDGKCYLAQQLKAASSQPESPQAPNSLQVQDFLAAHLAPSSIQFFPHCPTPVTGAYQLLAATQSPVPPTPPPRPWGIS
jgi:hypothetical protein